MKHAFSLFPIVNRSFAFKLTLLLLSVTLFIFTIATVILGIKWSDLLSKGLTARGCLLSQNATSHVNCAIDHVENLIHTCKWQIELNPDNFKRQNPETVRALFSQCESPSHNTISLVAGVALVTADGTVSYSFDKGTAGFDPSPPSADWYRRAQTGRTAFWTPPASFAPGSPEACLYVTPLLDPQTLQFRGALVAEVPAETFRSLIDKIRIDNEGNCILYFLHRPPVEDGISTREYPLVKGGGEFAETDAMFHSECRNGWKITVSMPGNWTTSRLWTLFRYVGWIFLITMPVVIFIAFILTKRITNPLTRLSEAAEAIGSGQFNFPLPKYRGKDEIAQLTHSFEQMQQELVSYLSELKKSFRRQQYIESELNIAKTIQTGILPKVEPPFSDSDRFELEAVLVPAKGVGGDLYDFFYLNETHLAVIVGDVSGKGIPAALFMSVTQTLQRSISFRYKEPGEIVTQLNKLLLINNEASMFVTYFIAVIDLCSGTMTYCNAGHNRPIIRRANGDLETLDQRSGLPLGIMEGTYSHNETRLGKNDTLVLYTDGITEAFNPRNKLFGEKRLKEAVSYAMSSSAANISQTILKHLEIFVESYEQSDDITLLALRMKEVSCPVDNEPHP